MSDQSMSVIPEHANGSESANRPVEYTPSTEEKRALKLTEKLFGKAKRYRKKFDEKWIEDYKMFRGKQWSEVRPSYRHSEVVNFIFQAIQASVPVLTDSRPKFDFLPQNPSDFEFAGILSEVAESDWEKNNWLLTLCEPLLDAHIYGTGIVAVDFKADRKNPSGSYKFESVDPMYCYPAPKARGFKSHCPYYIEAIPTALEEIRRDYPEKGKYVKSDVVDLMNGDRQELDQVKYRSPIDSRTNVDGSANFEMGSTDEALKVTLWVYDEEICEEEKDKLAEDGTPALDDTGQPQKEYIQKLKYPNGRKIVVASGVVLEDGPFEYEDGLIPRARLVNYLNPREFWGISDIENLKSPQKIFNKLVSFALAVTSRLGNPIWVVGTGSGVDTDLLVNRPGLIVEAENPDQVQRQEGVQLQPHVLQLIDRMQNWFQEISGRSDVSQGAAPGGVTAAAAITELQEAAQTRMRLKSRNLDACLQDAGQLYKNRRMEFSSAPEIIRLTENENAQKFFKMHVEQVPQPDGTTQKVATIRPYVQNPVSGEYSESLEAKQYIITADFDVKVSTGSSLPFAKSQKLNLAFQLFDRQAIDRMELLKATDYPNWEAVEQRMAEKEAAAAQAEAEAEAAKAGGAPQAPPPSAA
jgi:hypothetical protein